MIRPLLFTLLAFWLTGCVTKKPAVLQTTENLKPFLTNPHADINRDERSRLYTVFLQKHYAPWLQEEVNITVESASWAIRHYAKKQLYGENRLPLLKERWRNWIKNANYTSLNTLRRQAITIYPCSLRLFPSKRPIFFNPFHPGEGYPFDYNQNSTIKAFTPLMVSHMSLDGGWAFVQTPFAFGWLDIRNIAYVTRNQIDKIIKRPILAVLEEGAPVYDGSQNFLFYAKMATLLPLIKEEEGFYRILVPKKRKQSLVLEESLIPKSWAKQIPLDMNGSNIVSIADKLLGEPYGWGGVAMNRDCSAMTRDFFMPFGIWLPRNSMQQSKIGKIIDLKKMSDTEKERMIIEKGVPFKTLIHLPGHIMLYVGTIGHKAYVMHNIWGLKTGENGRYIIAKAIISTLYLGKNLPDVKRDALLIRKIDSMNIVTYAPKTVTSTLLPRLKRLQYSTIIP